MNVRAPISDPTQIFPGRAIVPYSHDCDVTIVIPVRNEEANVAPLCAELREVMDKEVMRYEVIIVDDGSTDGTAAALNKATHDDPRFIIVELYRSFGQSAALSCGFNMARGKIIVPMDGDLQNDPHDIPKLIAQLDRRHDRVRELQAEIACGETHDDTSCQCGWNRLPSRAARSS